MFTSASLTSRSNSIIFFNAPALLWSNVWAHWIKIRLFPENNNQTFMNFTVCRFEIICSDLSNRIIWISQIHLKLHRLDPVLRIHQQECDRSIRTPDCRLVLPRSQSCSVRWLGVWEWTLLGIFIPKVTTWKWFSHTDSQKRWSAFSIRDLGCL